MIAALLLGALSNYGETQPPAASDEKLRPCLYSPEARQFNFWVGEWDVYTPAGGKAGYSKIEQIAGGCGILENWTSALSGSGGKSLNFYDAETKKWHQYWIGSDGIPHRFAGVYADGAMRFEREPYMQNGRRMLGRLTFFNLDANTVRQLAEASDDDGKTWKVSYDFKYVRTK
jgi:hypothetical protein